MITLLCGAMMSSETIKKFWDIDFKAIIPVILFLITQMIVGAVWISKIDTRLTVREMSAEAAAKRLEKLEADRDAIIRVQEQLKNIQLSFDKLDRKLDSFSSK